MTYFLIGNVNEQWVIFGDGSSLREALTSGKNDATKHNVTRPVAVPETRLPKGTKWFDEQ